MVKLFGTKTIDQALALAKAAQDEVARHVGYT